jgi:hypothetical protein
MSMTRWQVPLNVGVAENGIGGSNGRKVSGLIASSTADSSTKANSIRSSAGSISSVPVTGPGAGLSVSSVIVAVSHAGSVHSRASITEPLRIGPAWAGAAAPTTKTMNTDRSEAMTPDGTSARPLRVVELVS